MESDLIEKTTQYEKDILLWESKLKFIEKERESLQKENSESLKRFESILDTIQKRHNEEKAIMENKLKLNINNINDIELKYQKQIKDIQDEHKKVYMESINKNKEFEKEIKALKIEKENNFELNKQLEEINQEKEKYKK